MPIFVHIADERDSKSIQKNGLTLPKNKLREYENEARKWGVFALPVINDFMISHQWVRELKRRGHRNTIGIYFRIPDDEMVWAGIYTQAKSRITAAEAAARLSNEKILGYEVIIPRSIISSEITAIRTLPNIGWRFFPEAKGKPPFCLCKYCNRGDIKSMRMRKRLDPNGDYA